MVQVQVQRVSRRQKQKLVKVIKLSTSNRFGEQTVDLKKMKEKKKKFRFILREILLSFLDRLGFVSEWFTKSIKQLKAADLAKLKKIPLNS